METKGEILSSGQLRDLSLGITKHSSYSKAFAEYKKAFDDGYAKGLRDAESEIFKLYIEFNKNCENLVKRSVDAISEFIELKEGRSEIIAVRKEFPFNYEVLFVINSDFYYGNKKELYEKTFSIKKDIQRQESDCYIEFDFLPFLEGFSLNELQKDRFILFQDFIRSSEE